MHVQPVPTSVDPSPGVSPANSTGWFGSSSLSTVAATPFPSSTCQRSCQCPSTWKPALFDVWPSPERWATTTSPFGVVSVGCAGAVVVAGPAAAVVLVAGATDVDDGPAAESVAGKDVAAVDEDEADDDGADDDRDAVT